MNVIKQISHTEYDSDISTRIGFLAPDPYIDRVFRDTPAFADMSFMERRNAGRLTLVSQEIAGHHRHGFYHRYIGSLARVGLNSIFIHHVGSETGVHHPENIPSEALSIFARAVYMRGQELNNHPLYHDSSQGASAELGYVTQFADWNIDEDLNDAIAGLPTNPSLAEIGIDFDTIHDNIESSDISYKAKITDNPDRESDFPAVTLSRIRPVADLRLCAADRADHVLQVVKRSTFAFSPDLTDQTGLRLTNNFLREGEHKGVFVDALGQDIVERAIAEYREGIVSKDTFPAESLYFAILRKRSVK